MCNSGQKLLGNTLKNNTIFLRGGGVNSFVLNCIFDVFNMFAKGKKNKLGISYVLVMPDVTNVIRVCQKRLTRLDRNPQ